MRIKNIQIIYIIFIVVIGTTFGFNFNSLAHGFSPAACWPNVNVHIFENNTLSITLIEGGDRYDKNQGFLKSDWNFYINGTRVEDFSEDDKWFVGQNWFIEPDGSGGYKKSKINYSSFNRGIIYLTIQISGHVIFDEEINFNGTEYIIKGTVCSESSSNNKYLINAGDFFIIAILISIGLIIGSIYVDSKTQNQFLKKHLFGIMSIISNLLFVFVILNSEFNQSFIYYDSFGWDILYLFIIPIIFLLSAIILGCLGYYSKKRNYIVALIGLDIGLIILIMIFFLLLL